MFEVSITKKINEFPITFFVETEEEAWKAVATALKNGAYKATFIKV